MSQELAEFVQARESALRLALDVLVAERNLSDEAASVTALNLTEDAFVVACARVAATARTLPLPRQPKGLSEVDR